MASGSKRMEPRSSKVIGFSQGSWECHDDPISDPTEGTSHEILFPWLGALQYIHVKNGTPHYFRVPRVILVSRQFALSTAEDAARCPDDYALGNVVFNDYERDEWECEITLEQMGGASDCEPAVLLMPIADVLLHPEFVHFKVKDSLALLKLMKPIVSVYVVPVCLPLKEYVVDGKLGKNLRLYYLDYSTDVPRDFTTETKDIKVVNLIPQEICNFSDNQNATRVEHIICTTGCNFHSGGPIVLHEHTGHWTVVSISEGGSPCPDPLVARKTALPPRHILLQSYVPWITAAISGRALGVTSKSDPFGFAVARSGGFEIINFHDIFGHFWNGHWWMGGIRCRDRGAEAEDLFRFYHEVFQVKPENRTRITYYLEIDADSEHQIVCVKVGMPYRFGQPKVWELDSPMVKVYVPLIVIHSKYSFHIEAYAYNYTESTASSTSESK